MNTGIYYLYEYKENQKIRNAGFIKITRQEHTCFFQIHARSIPVASQDTVRLFAFYLENSETYAKEIAVLPCQNRMISEKASVSELLFPKQYSLHQIDGFFLTLPTGEILTAAASNLEFDTRKIRDVPEQIPPAITPEPEMESAPAESESVESEPTAPIPVKPESPKEPVEESCLKEDAAPVNPVSNLVEKEIVRKIQRSELTCLPRRHWNLANNSFLLHGYSNYNHLLLIEEDGHYWLGVPGIYDPKESRAAELFGFSQFTDIYNEKLTLTEDERNDYGRFGYWCRYIK